MHQKTAQKQPAAAAAAAATTTTIKIPEHELGKDTLRWSRCTPYTCQMNFFSCFKNTGVVVLETSSRGEQSVSRRVTCTARATKQPMPKKTLEIGWLRGCDASTASGRGPAIANLRKNGPNDLTVVFTASDMYMCISLS